MPVHLRFAFISTKHPPLFFLFEAQKRGGAEEAQILSLYQREAIISSKTDRTYVGRCERGGQKPLLAQCPEKVLLFGTQGPGDRLDFHNLST